MVQTLCLDLMGTVVYDPFREAIEAATGRSLREVIAHKDPGSWPRFELAEIDEATFAATFWADPDAGLPFDLEAFNRVRRAGYRYLPGMRELLHDVQGVLSCHIASNYPVWIDELVETFALRELTDGIWASHHLGARKPDIAFYERLLDKVGQPAESCLFVDDRRVNCEAAQVVGMRAHVFTDAQDLRARLAAEGVGLPR